MHSLSTRSPFGFSEFQICRKYSKIKVTRICGRVAQLGEHLLCKQGVAGSNPATSTKSPLKVMLFACRGGVASFGFTLVLPPVGNSLPQTQTKMAEGVVRILAKRRPRRPIDFD